MTRWPTILLLLALGCAVGSAQPKPIDPDNGVLLVRGNLSNVPVSDLMNVYTTASGKQIHVANGVTAKWLVSISAPSQEGVKIDNTVMLELLEGVFRRNGCLLVTRADGDFDLVQAATAPATEVNDKQLEETAADARVRYVMEKNWQGVALTPREFAPRGCVIDGSSGKWVITGKAQDVRTWRGVIKRTEFSYGLVVKEYAPPPGWTPQELEAVVTKTLRAPTFARVVDNKLEVATYGVTHEELADLIARIK
jgi:hypothetical protein